MAIGEQRGEVDLLTELGDLGRRHAGADVDAGDAELLRPPVVEHLRSVFPDVMRSFYRELAPPGARYWGDKNPHYADPFNHGTLDLGRTAYAHAIWDQAAPRVAPVETETAEA